MAETKPKPGLMEEIVPDSVALVDKGAVPSSDFAVLNKSEASGPETSPVEPAPEVVATATPVSPVVPEQFPLEKAFDVIQGNLTELSSVQKAKLIEMALATTEPVAKGEVNLPDKEVVLIQAEKPGEATEEDEESEGMECEKGKKTIACGKDGVACEKVAKSASDNAVDRLCLLVEKLISDRVEKSAVIERAAAPLALTDDEILAKAEELKKSKQTPAERAAIDKLKADVAALRKKLMNECGLDAG
jgi:hypothetical protein